MKLLLSHTSTGLCLAATPEQLDEIFTKLGEVEYGYRFNAATRGIFIGPQKGGSTWNESIAGGRRRIYWLGTQPNLPYFGATPVEVTIGEIGITIRLPEEMRPPRNTVAMRKATGQYVEPEPTNRELTLELARPAEIILRGVPAETTRATNVVIEVGGKDFGFAVPEGDLLQTLLRWTREGYGTD